jgi:hypothetical protein
MFRRKYSIERISAAIGRLSTNCNAFYSTFAVKHRAQYPVYAMSTMIPVISNKITFIDIQDSIFNLTYLLRYWSYDDNSMRLILHICCQIQSTISGLRYVKSGPSQIQYNYSSSYVGFNIHLNVSPLRLVVYRKIDACDTSNFCQIQGTISGLHYANSGLGLIQHKYIS